MALYYGTRLHAYAADAIELKRRQPKGNDTVSMYVNDAISYRMKPEQPLYYSDKCFGTCDAICYSERKKFLRIHDLKTGEVPAHMRQLEIYAALFILEYGQEVGVHSPEEIQIELRIYQNGEVVTENPDPEVIKEIMDKIVDSVRIIKEIDMEGIT
jgi:hypothetical protein